MLGLGAIGDVCFGDLGFGALQNLQLWYPTTNPGPAATTAAMVTRGLALDLDSRYGVTQSSGAVSSWTDENALSAAFGVSAASGGTGTVVYTAADAKVGSLPSVAPPTTGDMQMSRSIAPQPCTVFIVGYLTQANPTYSIIIGSSGTDIITQNEEAQSGISMVDDAYVYAGVISNTNAHTHVFVLNGSSSAIYIDGIVAPGLNPGTDGIIGALLLGSTALSGTLFVFARVIIHNVLLSAAEILQQQGYLANLYGTPAPVFLGTQATAPATATSGVAIDVNDPAFGSIGGSSQYQFALTQSGAPQAYGAITTADIGTYGMAFPQGPSGGTTLRPDGTSVPGTYGADSWQTPTAVTGYFLASYWAASLAVIALAQLADGSSGTTMNGNVNLQIAIWAGSDPKAVAPVPRLLSAYNLPSGQNGSSVTLSTVQNLLFRFLQTGFQLYGEYLFFQFGWSVDTTATNYSGVSVQVGPTTWIASYNSESANLSGVASMTSAMSVARHFTLSAAGDATIVDAIRVARGFKDTVAGAATANTTLRRAVPFLDGGGIAGAARLVDPLQVARHFISGIVGVSTPTITPLRVARALVVAVNGLASVVAAFKATRPLAVALAGAATTTEAMTVQRALKDSLAGQATVVDALRVQRKLLDVIAGAVSLALPLAAARPLALSVAGTSSVADALAVARHLLDAMAGQAAVTDALKATRPLGLSVSAAATLVDAFGIAFPLAVVIVGEGSITDALRVSRALADVVLGDAALVDAATVQRAFAGVVASSSTMVDTLRVLRGLLDGGGILGGATLGAFPLVVARKLLEAAVGQATQTGTVTASRPLALSVHGDVSLAAALAVSNAFAVSVAGAGAVVVPMCVARGFVVPIEGSGSVTDALGATRGLAGAAEGAAAVTDAATVQRNLGAGLAGGAAISATEKIARAFGLSASAASHLVAALGRERPMTSAFTGVSSVTDALSVIRGLELGVVGNTVLVASLIVFNSDLQFEVFISGSASVTDAATIARPLGLVAHGDGAMADTLDVERQLSAFVANSAELAMQARVARALTAPGLQGQAAVTDTLSASRPFTAGLDGTTYFAAGLGASRPMLVALHGEAVVSVAIQLQVGLAEAMAGQGSMEDLMVVARALGAEVLGDASVAAALGVALGFSVEVEGQTIIVSSLGFGIFGSGHQYLDHIRQLAYGTTEIAPVVGAGRQALPRFVQVGHGTVSGSSPPSTTVTGVGRQRISRPYQWGLGTVS